MGRSSLFRGHFTLRAGLTPLESGDLLIVIKA